MCLRHGALAQTRNEDPFGLLASTRIAPFTRAAPLCDPLRFGCADQAAFSLMAGESCRAMAHMKATNSGAIAVTTTLACLPRALSQRNLLHSRSYAFQAISRMGCGTACWRC